MKSKGFTGKKWCSGNQHGQDKELYKFKNGGAIVPGFYFSKKPVKITLSEFKILCR